MNINNASLQRLLNLTKRPQVVAGKPQDQVLATILRFENDSCTTTSLVRDGKTSLSHFRVPAHGSGQIPIPDIDRLLGVLKFHGSSVTLSLDGSKLRIKSGSKQTTLLSDLGGLAFPHSTDTIGEWEGKSVQLSEQIDPKGSYTLRSGDKREAMLSWTVDATELFEALRCDTMNGQKLNRYIFSLGEGKITLSVGDELKGHTTTEWENEETDFPVIEVVFEGGLDSVLKEMTGNIDLHFIDFRAEEQGIRLIIDCGGSGWIFQASLLR